MGFRVWSLGVRLRVLGFWGWGGGGGGGVFGSLGFGVWGLQGLVSGLRSRVSGLCNVFGFRYRGVHMVFLGLSGLGVYVPQGLGQQILAPQGLRALQLSGEGVRRALGVDCPEPNTERLLTNSTAQPKPCPQKPLTSQPRKPPT